MSRVLLCSPARVKRDTALGSTVDEDLLNPYIFITQERHIHPALGTQLYEKIRELIALAQIDDLPNRSYKTLLTDYIIPCLAQMCLVEVSYVMRLRWANNSIVMADSDVGGSASIQDIKLALERTTSIGMFFRERLIDYLTNNVEEYPEYNTNQAADLQPSTRNYFQGINVDPKQPIPNRLKAIAQGIGLKGYT